MPQFASELVKRPLQRRCRCLGVSLGGHWSNPPASHGSGWHAFASPAASRQPLLGVAWGGSPPAAGAAAATLSSGILFSWPRLVGVLATPVPPCSGALSVGIWHRIQYLLRCSSSSSLRRPHSGHSGLALSFLTDASVAPSANHVALLVSKRRHGSYRRAGVSDRPPVGKVPSGDKTA